ncbi:MAG: histidine--tRNA ligase [Chitinophagaceae bacterium]
MTALIKPSIPKGTRDFSPEVVRKRNFILQTIRTVFEIYGYQPLETPAIENLSTLNGKYGEEGDKLIFKILDNGDILGRALQAKNSRELATLICEKALRYDLTIPFARFVVMHQQDLVFPFKRYQIQPVWRADRPQRGRYREFYQCDADVVGSPSLLNEMELLQMYDQALTQLQIPGIEIRINHRKILSGLAQTLGKPELLTDITISIDKLDKIGEGGVRKELMEKGLSDQEIQVIEDFFHIQGNTNEKISQLKNLLGESYLALQGIEELELIFHSDGLLLQHPLILDLTLARGLNYYTGTILEVKCQQVKMGSLGGGGRYDDLTGLFGGSALTGVGISFGVDRIYDVMEELDLFPKKTISSTQVLFINMGSEGQQVVFQKAMELRSRHIAVETYPDTVKIDRQFKYADRKGIPFVVIFGEKEIQEQSLSIKNLHTGKQETIPMEELIHYPFELE